MKRFLLALLAAAILAGCGFQLRGTASGKLPYASFHVALPDNADVGIWLKRYIKALGTTKLTATPEEAEAIFQQLYDTRQQTILSLNALGQVKEYRLLLTYGFRVVDAKGQVLVPPNEISLSRDMTYDASTVLAKDQEAALLWRDLNTDLVNQILRRLSIAKPKNPADEDQD